MQAFGADGFHQFLADPQTAAAALVLGLNAGSGDRRIRPGSDFAEAIAEQAVHPVADFHGRRGVGANEVWALGHDR